MYIPRSEAARRLKVTEGRLRQLEKKGKLVPIKASDVDYPPKKGAKARGEIKWVYDERQVNALVGKTGADVRFAREHRSDAVVFDMLTDGADAVDIVRRLRLDLPTVQRLRERYVEEKGGFVVSGRDVREAQELGFDLTSQSLMTVLRRVAEFVRGGKLTKDKLSRLKVIPDE
jgi:hypothetical protein